MLDPDIESELHRCFEEIPVLRQLRFRLDALDDGFCRVMVPRPDAFRGLYGTYHGGLLATVADCAAWIAIVSRLGTDAHLTTTDIHIRYLEPCFSEVAAEARVIKLGRTLCPVDVELYDDRHTRVATAQVTYMRLDRAPDQESE